MYRVATLLYGVFVFCSFLALSLLLVNEVKYAVSVKEISASLAFAKDLTNDSPTRQDHPTQKRVIPQVTQKQVIPQVTQKKVIPQVTQSDSPGEEVAKPHSTDIPIALEKISSDSLPESLIQVSRDSHSKPVESPTHNESSGTGDQLTQNDSVQEIALDTLKMRILKEVSNRSFEKLLEATLKAKSFASIPRPPNSQMVIASTWRSGSTFVMELLGSHAGVFVQYEPLLPYGMESFYQEGEGKAEEAQQVIMDILHCRYSAGYVLKMVKEMFNRNKKLWDVCKLDPRTQALCFQSSFLQSACSLFPWKLIKTTRIGVRLLEPALKDPSLNPYIIYLVRDPRAVIHSRVSSVDWCKEPSCADPAILCQHMESDYNAVSQFSKLYPGKVLVLRYEDLSLSPEAVTLDLLKNLQLDYDPLMEKFIKTHTTRNVNNPWSTTRQSSERVTHWLAKISADTLNKVQNSCSDIMSKLGYLTISSAEKATIRDILGVMSPIT